MVFGRAGEWARKQEEETERDKKDRREEEKKKQINTQMKHEENTY